MTDAKGTRSVNRLVPKLVPAVFGLSIFLASFAMFIVEPFVAKLLLPNLGGGPNVWNTCVLFFQITLLAGYLYAHVIGTRMPRSYQLVVHLIVIWAPLLVFPIRAPGTVPPGEHPFFWIFSMLSGMIGALFFSISTTAPLLQKWYAQTKLVSADDPYFLYAASNIGGLSGLLSYPFLLEPNLRLVEQSQLLLFVYLGFASLTSLCGLFIFFSQARNDSSTQGNKEDSGTQDLNSSKTSNTIEDDHRSGFQQWARVIVLTAIPSALVLAMTTYVTTDLSSIPLFWLIPLFVYLLSFIVAFGRMSALALKLCRWVAPLAVLVIVIFMTSTNASEVFLQDTLITTGISLHILTLFFVCLAYHGTVAGERPHTKHLTAYYLVISLGGVLGSCFSTLSAPAIFKGGEEYPLLLMTAAVLLVARPKLLERLVASTNASSRTAPQLLQLPGMPLGIILAVVTACWTFHIAFLSHAKEATNLGGTCMAIDTALELLIRFLVPICVALLITRSNLQYRLSLVALAGFVLWTYKNIDQSMVYRARNFFSRVSVAVNQASDRIELWNGDTLHGAESLNPAKKGLPYFYCYPDGPIGLIAKSVCREAWEDAVQDGSPRIRSDVSGSQPSELRSSEPSRSSVEERTVGGTDLLRSAPVRNEHPLIRSERSQRQSVIRAPLAPIAVMGLGSGIAAALAKPGQRIDFYEINPLVIDIADNPFYFTYLYQARKRKVDLHLVCGDGRLEIQKAPYKFYRLIISDTYSGNAIPVHMITKEAVASYLEKLTPDGVLAFNIVNAYYALRPVVARLAQEFGLDVLTMNEYDRTPEGVRNQYYIEWVILTRNKPLVEQLRKEGWQPLKADPKFRLWTDDYCNPLGVLEGNFS